MTSAGSSSSSSTSSSPHLLRSSSTSVGSIRDPAADDPARSRDYAPDDAARVTPVKRRRLLPLVDLRGGGMAGSSVELGGRGMGSLSGSLGQCRRSRTPLTDLAKSGLCVSSDTGDGGGVRITHLTGGSGMGVNVGGGMADMDEGQTRFPRLDQCAHFHYEYVELPPLQVTLVHEELKPLSAGTGYASSEDTENRSLLVQVASLGRSWVLRRTYDNFRFLDRQLHRCCYDRKFSHLPELPSEENLPGDDREAAVAGLLGEYVARLSEVAGSLITCGPVLNWLELDNRGHRLIVTDDSDINTPAVAAAYVVKRYIAQASDEISFEVGDMISVIDMPPPEESIWWRGKRGFQVGFFPCECVQVIGDKVPQTIQPQTLTLPPARSQPSVAAAGHQHHTLHSGAQAPTKPVLRKHGKLIAFFRSFILSRPSRRKLKQSGILRERVFGCDLGEHLLNSGHEIPMVLRCCSEFLENHGVVDGIYRLSGITSNIQKLRNAFDEDRIPDLYGDENILQDIHCVSSVLKMYFRELPNPLLTYQLYQKFVAAVMQDEDVRLLYLRDVVQQLPPPHYRTLEYLVQHLARIASHSNDTGMTPKNIAIVWAPNLLRSKDLDNGGVAALQDVGTQAVVTEYLVRYVDLIFNDKIPTFYHSPNGVEGTPKKSRPKSLAISTPTKLLSIEEARTRALNPTAKPDQKYIEVGGGPQNLPPKYHTVIELPSRKGGSLKQKKSPSGWKSIFTKGRSMHKHQRKASTPSDIHLNISDSVLTEADIAPSSSKRLRPVKSVESLISTSASQRSNRNSQALDSPGRLDTSDWESPERVANDERESRSSTSSSPIPSPRTHNRSVSHDSYFNTLENQPNNLPTQVPVKEEGESDLDFSPSHSRINLDISELDLNFSTSEKDLKGFEVDTLKSTSVEDPDDMSGSTLDMENLSMCSDSARSKENLSSRPEKKSLKEKIRHRFTSPPSQRRGDAGVSDSSEDSCNNSLKRASASLKDKIVYALSPETTRRRSDASPRPLSPCSSPKLKHVRTTEASNKGGHLKPESCSYVTGLKISEHDTNVETVLAEVHVEPGSRESGDTPSRQSMDSALIDPELLDKITHLRTSPSISASEVSNTSMAEVSISDNETFSLGTLGKSYSGLVVGTEIQESGSESGSVNLPSSATLITPGTPPVTIIAESSDTQEGTPVTPMDEDLTPLQEFPKPRPNSLLGLPTAELLTLGSALTSPETPQGDSTFLEIQYHPLSDTTEPSTPSESQFVQDLVAGGHTVPHPPVVDEPRQSSPLSIDLSSSEDPTEDGPMYENVDVGSCAQRGQSSECHYNEPVPLSPTTSIQSSLASIQTSQTSGQGLLLEGDITGSDVEYDNYNCSSEYENVKYGAEYENVEFRPEYPCLDFEIDDESIKDEDKRHSTSVDRVSDDKSGETDVSEQEISYENVQVTEGEQMLVDDVYENIAPSLSMYENLDESSDDQAHMVPEVDDAYEDYSFTEQPEYENVEFKSQQASAAISDVANSDKTEVEIEGEMVYQQVKFLRKSIQEVNEMLKFNGEKQRNDDGLSDSDDASRALETLMVDDTVNLMDNSSELPVQVPQMGDVCVPQSYESMPCSQNTISQPVEIAIDNDLCTQPSEDSECLDSPVTPSSTSLATEVLVLPSFASPTESTTDDVTSPVSSDDGSSPKPVQDPHSQCLSPAAGPPVLPSLSPSTPESVPVPPAATSTPNRTLTSIITPAPWPRTNTRHAPISAPVPRPRQLPKLNLSSPLISPVSTPSSFSISPDSPATPGTPSSASAHGTPTEEAPNFQVFQPSHSSSIAVPSQKSHAVESKVFHVFGEVRLPSESMKEPDSSGKVIGAHVLSESVDQDVKNSSESKSFSSAPPSSLQRFKTSPDFRLASKETEERVLSQENETQESENTIAPAIGSCNDPDSGDPLKRERIEKYKEERRSFLREKFKSDSFRGEKDEMLLRLKQKATSPSRPEDEDEMVHHSSNTRSLSPRRRGSTSPTKNLDIQEGKTSPTKHLGSTEKHSTDYPLHTDKKEEEDQGNAFKRTSPARRSLSDMGRIGELKSPPKTRVSSGSSSPAFQKNSSSSSSNNSNGSKSHGVTSPRSSLRKSSDKEVILRRSSSSEVKSNLTRKISSPTSPIKSPSSETSPFQRSASIGSRRKIVVNDNDEDVNVKERVAIWSTGKPHDTPQNKDTPVNKTDKVGKTEKVITKKQDVKSVKEKSVKESVTRKNSVPLSPTKKTSGSKVTSPSAPSVPKATPPSPGLPKAISFPSTVQKVPSASVPKNSVKSNIGEGSIDGNASGGNVAARGNSGQQRRIRDMAAIFERDSPTSAKPGLLRQSSREEKKERKATSP